MNYRKAWDGPLLVVVGICALVAGPLGCWNDEASYKGSIETLEANLRRNWPGCKIPREGSPYVRTVLTEDEEQRLRAAIDMLRRREIPQEPYLITAEIHDHGGTFGFGVEFLDRDDAAVGLIIEEIREGQPPLRELYPFFSCNAWWRRIFKGNPVKVLSISSGPYVPGRTAEAVSSEGIEGVLSGIEEEAEIRGSLLRIRTKGQRKDTEAWQEFCNASPKEQERMPWPVIWVSLPVGCQVNVSVYDASGNSSESLPLMLRYTPDVLPPSAEEAEERVIEQGAGSTDE